MITTTVVGLLIGAVIYRWLRAISLSRFFLVAWALIACGVVIWVGVGCCFSVWQILHAEDQFRPDPVQLFLEALLGEAMLFFIPMPIAAALVAWPTVAALARCSNRRSQSGRSSVPPARAVVVVSGFIVIGVVYALVL